MEKDWCHQEDSGLKDEADEFKVDKNRILLRVQTRNVREDVNELKFVELRELPLVNLP